MKAHLAGALPRSEPLIETTRLAARGNVSSNELSESFVRGARSAVALQIESGLDFVTDGQLNWQDLFRPFSECLTGLKSGALTRWYDNNTFYRKPIITEKLEYRKDSIKNYFRRDLVPEGITKQAIVPGPFTFAKLSDNAHYHSFADTLDDIAHAMRSLASELANIGYARIQFNEPELAQSRTNDTDLESAHRAYEICTAGTGAQVGIHTYFGDVSAFIPRLLDFPIDHLGIDFYATSIEHVVEYDFDMELSCGCIDGRNSLIESTDELTRLIRTLQSNMSPKRLTVTTNCDLDFLPFSIAEKKVRRLGELKRRIE